MKTRSASKPRERRHIRTRQAIIDAAREIVFSEGVEQLSLRRLARKIDYSPAAVYRYFESKDEIIAALREEGWAIKNAMTAELKNTRLRYPDLLMAVGQSHLQFAVRYPHYYRLMFATSRGMPRNFKELSETAEFKGLSGLLQTGIDRGYIRKPKGADAAKLHFLIWFMSHGIAMLRFTTLKDWGPEFDAIVTDVLKMFWSYLSGR